MLKEYHNAVMIYKNDRPYKKTDIVISSLPVEEKLKLKKGIPASDYAEVERLIEMYES